MDLEKNIVFKRPKQFIPIRELGRGGTGKTILVKDEVIDRLFAIKKYSPNKINAKKRSENYNRFVDEIKILYHISHPNIVRIYNYYLYPEKVLGYIQMEYIEGVTIEEFTAENPSHIDSLFKTAINAFKFLENNKILHRDIKSDNILINNNNELKIIDFGFGKIQSSQHTKNSVKLNWPVSEDPEEVAINGDYLQQTEIYFLGTLFKKLINNSKYKDFKYEAILKKMCEINFDKRYQSFNEINDEISKSYLINIEFSNSDKKVYLNFIQELEYTIIHFNTDYIPNEDLNQIISDLEDILQVNSLEENIQHNQKLINVFVKNNYRYSTANIISVDVVRNFYELLMNQSLVKKNIIINNLNNRLATIKISYPIDEMELPF